LDQYSNVEKHDKSLLTEVIVNCCGFCQGWDINDSSVTKSIGSYYYPKTYKTTLQ